MKASLAVRLKPDTTSEVEGGPQVVDVGLKRVVAAISDLADNRAAHRPRSAGKHLAIDLGVYVRERLAIAAFLMAARFHDRVVGTPEALRPDGARLALLRIQ